MSRTWNAALAVIITATLIVQLALNIRSGVPTLMEDDPAKAPERVLRFFSYFTIQSNIILAAGVATLAVNPQRDGKVWRVLRLDGVLGITVTGLIYITVLHGLVELEGLRVLTNAGVHYIAPIAGVLGWLLFGPRGRTDVHTLAWALVWPLAWIGYTLIMGEITDWYPYPFIDVSELGYGTVAVNLVAVLVLGVALLWIFRFIDHRKAASVMDAKCR